MLEALQGAEVRDKVVVLKARNIGAPASPPLAALVRACWNLESIGTGCCRFIERFRPLLRALKSARQSHPEQCFAVRTLLVHEARRVLLRDPQLPARLLSSNRPCAAARELCRDLYLVTYREAEAHRHATLEAESGGLPEAQRDFYERFDGLPRQPPAGAQGTL